MKDSYHEHGTLQPIIVEPGQVNRVSELLNILRECLNEKHYEMIKLHYVEGFHWDELAGSFGYSSPDSASHAVRNTLWVGKPQEPCEKRTSGLGPFVSPSTCCATRQILTRRCSALKLDQRDDEVDDQNVQRRPQHGGRDPGADVAGRMLRR